MNFRNAEAAQLLAISIFGSIKTGASSYLIDSVRFICLRLRLVGLALLLASIAWATPVLAQGASDAGSAKPALMLANVYHPGV